MMSKSKTAKSFIFLFRSTSVGYGDVLVVGFADVCFFFFFLFFFFLFYFFLVVVGLMSVGVIGFMTNVVVVVVVEVVIDIGGGAFDKCGYDWICD